MSLGLVDELEKYVINGSSDEGTESKEFAIDAMKSGLEEITLPRIF